MTRGEIVKALRCSASTWEKDCTGCCYLVKQEAPEHLRRVTKETVWENCDVDQIALDAADLLENDENQAFAMQRELELQRARLDCATACADRIHRQNKELRDTVALVKKPTGDAAVEREWIPVAERLPEEHDSIFAKAYGTKRWADGMFRTISDEVLVCVAFEDGRKVTMTLRTHDGAWALSSVHRGHVTHWMPLPEAPEVEREGEKS